MLSLSAYRDLNVLRFVADSAAQENLTPTPVDLNKILMSLGETYAEVLSDAERSVCDRFPAGRRVLEEYINDPKLALHMTEEDKEEYTVAERHFSRTLEQMILLVLKFRPSHVLCITTASLLNTMGTEHGAFAGCSSRFKVLIGDKASQIPELVLAAFASLLLRAQQVYIRDTHQLEPLAKCHRESNPIIYGARSIMSVLW
ncbi:hypothetical protein RB195_024997 [Necator americanus]|uniref:Uncharacterized protein n=1 Tax=Necator americanus TaxID=51031 RepID=A0ABR1EQH5_NECAM